MMAKYNVEYALQFKRHAPMHHYYSDDPVACEEFLSELLERGFRVNTIRHDGMDLPKADFDKMIKKAAGMVAAKSVCNALGISAEEEHYRFGFTA
jgi:hypothetical protein